MMGARCAARLQRMVEEKHAPWPCPRFRGSGFRTTSRSMTRRRASPARPLYLRTPHRLDAVGGEVRANDRDA